MCASVCRIYLLLCSTYFMLVLNHQNILSQKLRPSKWLDSVLQVDSQVSVHKSNKEARHRRDSLQIRNDRPGQLGFRRNMETSCRDKCGQLFDLPCSCDSQCLVYKNCCEDLNLECPEMLVEAESLYTPELLNSQTECIHNGVLAISSCPNVSSVDTANLSNTWINEHRERMSRLQAALFGKESLTNTDEDSQSEKQGQSILQLLSDVPVSDISTGLLYKTPEIFSCYIEPPSVPAPWNIQIASSTILAGVKEIHHLKVEKDEVAYIPPTQLPSDGAYKLCVPHAIGTCKYSQDMCEPFFSYVYVLGQARTFTVYKNKYCAFCNGLKGEHIRNLTKYDGSRNYFALSVIMSISNDKIKLSMVNKGRMRRLLPWKEAECDLSKERQVTQNASMSACHIDSCGQTDVLRPDGTCKSLQEFRMALSDHGHIPFSLNDQDPKIGQGDSSQKVIVEGSLGALPDLIRCTLETHFGYELGEATYPLMIRRDHRLNATMFVADVQLYMALKKSIFEQMDMSISAMSLIAKALFLYNKTWYLTPRTKLENIIDSYNRTILEEIKTIDGNLNYAPTEKFSFKAQNCSEIIDNFTICVCDMYFATFLVNRDERCRLRCFEDTICKNQVEMIQTFSESECFSFFRRLASCGTSWTLSSSVFLWFLIASVIWN